MPAKRPHIRKDGLRDGRSRPRLRPCPPEDQRYILRRVGKRGLDKIVWKGKEGHKPSEDEIYQYLAKRKWVKCTYLLMSTRPRPKLVFTYKWELDESGKYYLFKSRKAG